MLCCSENSVGFKITLKQPAAVLARGLSGFLLKDGVEIGLRGKAAAFGDCRHVQCALQQQLLGVLQADVNEILLGRDLKMPHKQLAEIDLAHVTFSRQARIG